MLCNSSTLRAHSVKSTRRSNNTVTTGNWSLKWKRDSSHTPRRQWQIQRWVTDDCSPMPATEHNEECWQVSQTAAAKLQHHTTTPDMCDASNSKHRPVTNVDMAVVGLTEERWRIKMSWRSDDETIQWTDNTWLTIDNWQLMIDNWW